MSSLRDRLPAAKIGQVIGGRFLLTSILGEGSSAVTYLAVHQRLSKEFAVKLLRPGLVRDRLAAGRFLREAQLASVLSHPHLVHIYDYGISEEHGPYLVMEYVHGVLLPQVIAATPGQSLQLGQAVDIGLQIARGLSHMHASGISHRNLKPSHILLTHRDGHADFVKLLDLSVARQEGSPPLTLQGQVVGTPEFIPPEGWQQADASIASVGVDMYALGALFHYMIAGSSPFVGETSDLLLSHLYITPQSLAQRSRRSVEIPRALDDLVGQLLSKAPSERPTASQVINRLSQIQAQLPPPSLHSLLLCQTLILAPSQRATQPLLRPATSIVQKTVILAEDRETHPETAALPGVLSLLGHVDALEAEIEHLTRRITELAESLGWTLWPTGWPEGVGGLHDYLLEQAAKEDTLGLQLAVHEEEARTISAEQGEKRNTLRRRVVWLSRAVQGAPTADTREELERAEQELDQIPTEAPAELLLAVAAERRSLHELRAEVQQGWLKLATLILQHSAAEGHKERRRLEVLIEQVEANQLAMARLLA